MNKIPEWFEVKIDMKDGTHKIVRVGTPLNIKTNTEFKKYVKKAFEQVLLDLIKNNKEQ